MSRRNRAFDFSEAPVLGKGNGWEIGEVIPGCRYAWFKELGNPSRKLPWSPIEPEKAEETLSVLAKTIRREGDTQYAGPLVLVCSETDYRRCHRREIAERLAEMTACEVIHLALGKRAPP